MKSRAVLLLIFMLLFPPSASADWVVTQHDRHRTGSSSGTANLSKPAVTWRYYLGGTLTRGQVQSVDVDKNGDADIVYISGGRIVVKTPDDKLIWETKPMGLTHLIAVLDIDGDGVLDVIAKGQPLVVAIFRGSDGKLEWRTDRSFFVPRSTTIGAVRITDLNGDKKPDLYLADIASGSGGEDIAFAYDFTKGYGSGVDDGKSQRLWQLERGREYNNGSSESLIDVNGDGIKDLVVLSSTMAYVFDGKTGKKISSGKTDGGYPLGFSTPYGVSKINIANVDDDPLGEIIVSTNNGYSPSINSRMLFVLDWDATRPTAERLKVLWKRSVANLTSDEHEHLDDITADLDGDGKNEIATTFVISGKRTTWVLRGDTGAELASIADERSRGFVELTGHPRPLLLTSTSSGDIHVYDFPSLPFAAPTASWSISGAGLPSTTHDAGRAIRQNSSVRPFAIHVASGKSALVVNTRKAVSLWSLEIGKTAIKLHDYALPSDIEIVIVAPEEGLSKTTSGLMLVRSDGYLLVLDDTLTPVNFYKQGEFQRPGVRIGGYYSGPNSEGNPLLAASFGKSQRELIVVDSRSRLLRLDASSSSLIKGPKVIWTEHGRCPGITKIDGDTINDVYFHASSRKLRALSGATGKEIFSTDFSTFTQDGETIAVRQYACPLHYEKAGSLGGVVVNTHSGQNGKGYLRTIDPKGAITWTSKGFLTAGSGQGLITVDDIDGDGQDDAMLNMAGYLTLYDFNQTSGAYRHRSKQYQHTGIVTRVKGMAGDITHLAGSAWTNYTAFSITAWNTQVKWEDKTLVTSNQFPAVLTCPNTVAYVGQPLRYSSEMFIAEVQDIKTQKHFFLVNGKLYPTRATLDASGDYPGQLTNVSGIASISKTNKKPAFLVGSTDGYLYAIDACATKPTLLWSISLRAAVGQPIFADLDGDGDEELAVSVADGFLYGIDTEAIAAPSSVIDIDLSRGISNVDVDTTHDFALRAKWTAVKDARSYEYAVYTEDGTPVSRNPKDETNPFIATQALEGSWSQSLKRGGRYFFVVRTIGAKGASPEALSDGVLYDPKTQPSVDGGSSNDGGKPGDASANGDMDQVSGSGCACNVGDAESSTDLLLFLLFTFVVVIARRRHLLRE